MKIIFSKTRLFFNHTFLLFTITLPASFFFLPVFILNSAIAMLLSMDSILKNRIFIRISGMFGKFIFPLLYIYWTFLIVFLVRNVGLRYFIVIITFIAFFVLLNRRLRLRSSRIFFIFYWIIVGILVYFMDFYPAYALYALSTLFVILFRTYKFDFISRLNIHTIVLFLIATLTISVGGIFYLGISKNEYRRIEKQDGVRTIFGYGRNKKLDSIIERHIKFVIESCDGSLIYIGSQGFNERKRPFFVAMDKKTRKVRKSIDVISTSYNGIIDCEKGLLYTIGLWLDEVLVFKDSDISQPIKRYALKISDPWMVLLNKKKDFLFVGDGHTFFEIIDIEKDEGIIQKRIGGNFFTFFLPLIDDSIITMRDSEIEIMDLDRINRTLYSSKKIKWGELKVDKDLEREAPEKLHFFTSLLSGRLYIVDINNFYLKKAIKLERGIRFYHYDGIRGLLFVGGYLKGNLFIVDIEKAIILKKLYLGRRIRWINMSRDRTKILTGSAAGAFEIDIEEAIGNGQLGNSNQ